MDYIVCVILPFFVWVSCAYSCMQMVNRIDWQYIVHLDLFVEAYEAMERTVKQKRV